MKLRIITILACLLIAGSGISQDVVTDVAKKSLGLRPTMDVAAGYVFNYQDIRASVAFNNLFLKWGGVFTAAEISPDDGNFTHILGFTLRPVPYLYVFAGIDVFTHRGIIQQGFEGCRKSIGIGIYPWNWTVVKLGYSFKAGVTAEVGVRVPLGKM
jgi:hypothetical protein